jgi:hypothetical protein
MLSKVIFIQIIITKSNIENNFYTNTSKHKSNQLNSLLIKINSIKINFVKINSIHRRPSTYIVDFIVQLLATNQLNLKIKYSQLITGCTLICQQEN